MTAEEVQVNYGDGLITNVQMIVEDMDVICDVIRKMPEDGLMVEWGSGGSTCKWIETLSPRQKLISIEHHDEWYSRVARAIRKQWGDTSDRFTYFFRPEIGFKHGYGNVTEEHPCGTAKYINPDDRIWDADVFFVDGIARAACLMAILHRRTKPNSVIMMHDYTGREDWYDWAVQFFNVQTFTHLNGYSTLAILTPKKG